MVMFRNCNKGETEHEKIVNVGYNTGNLIFTYALQKNMHVDTMPSYQYFIDEEKQSVTDAILVTDLIWITENGNFDYLIEQMNKIDKPFIPISVGIQNSLSNINYNLNESAKRVLEMMQERAVLGVRGEITADILQKNGIKNIQIIGCPSMYYWSHPNYKIIKKDIRPTKVLYNFRTFYGKLSRYEAHFLTYGVNRKYDFIEQTEHWISQEMCPSTQYYDYIGPKLKEKRHIFFSVEEWKEYARMYDFSIGARFHGNVVALWEGIPSLFIMIDSRMKEMLDFFKLPYIEMKDFDDTKDIRYYYELADYEEFNKNYENTFYNYLGFLEKNNIFY